MASPTSTVPFPKPLRENGVETARRATEWRRGNMRIANTAGDPAIYDHFGRLHVIYRDLSGPIYDAWFEGGIWRRHDVTNESKPPTSPKGDPFGFGWAPSQRIDFRGKDDHIYQLS